MPWVTRGLRNGVLTSALPASARTVTGPTGGVPSRAPATAVAGARALTEELCPTGAIGQDAGGGVALDRGKCILCGRCVARAPGPVRFRPSPEVASPARAGLVVPAPRGKRDRLGAGPCADLGRRVRALRRSVHVRHVDAGSDGSEEWEIAALLNPVYDVHRLGIFFTASPRHADLLLVRARVRPGWPGRCARPTRPCPTPG